MGKFNLYWEYYLSIFINYELHLAIGDKLHSSPSTHKSQLKKMAVSKLTEAKRKKLKKDVKGLIKVVSTNLEEPHTLERAADFLDGFETLKHRAELGGIPPVTPEVAALLKPIIGNGGNGDVVPTRTRIFGLLFPEEGNVEESATAAASRCKFLTDLLLQNSPRDRSRGLLLACAQTGLPDLVEACVLTYWFELHLSDVSRALDNVQQKANESGSRYLQRTESYFELYKRMETAARVGLIVAGGGQMNAYTEHGVVGLLLRGCLRKYKDMQTQRALIRPLECADRPSDFRGMMIWFRELDGMIQTQANARASTQGDVRRVAVVTPPTGPDGSLSVLEDQLNRILTRLDQLESGRSVKGRVTQRPPKSFRCSGCKQSGNQRCNHCRECGGRWIPRKGCAKCNRRPRNFNTNPLSSSNFVKDKTNTSS